MKSRHSLESGLELQMTLSQLHQSEVEFQSSRPFLKKLSEEDKVNSSTLQECRFEVEKNLFLII